VAVGHDNGIIQIIDGGRGVRLVEMQAIGSGAGVLGGYVQATQTGPRQRIIAPDAFGKLVVFDAETGERHHQVEGYYASVTGLSVFESFITGRTHLACVGLPSNVRPSAHGIKVLDAEPIRLDATGVLTTVEVAHSATITAVAVYQEPRGHDRIVTASLDG
jgi:hypothetical protein